MGKTGLTSVEAAALIASGGKTKDPELANVYAEGKEFEMDGLTRAALRRAMGFDFKVKQAPNYFHLYSIGDIQVSTRSKIYTQEVDTYGNIIDEDAINRLVKATVKLKRKWDAKRADNDLR